MSHRWHFSDSSVGRAFLVWDNPNPRLFRFRRSIRFLWFRHFLFFRLSQFFFIFSKLKVSFFLFLRKNLNLFLELNLFLGTKIIDQWWGRILESFKTKIRSIVNQRIIKDENDYKYWLVYDLGEMWPLTPVTKMADRPDTTGTLWLAGLWLSYQSELPTLRLPKWTNVVG